MIPRIQEGHVVDVVAAPLSPWEADTVSRALRRVEHIPVRADVRDGAVHLCAARALTTPEEVTVLRGFAAVTDLPLRWDGLVKS